jgi:CheY-like chemotaxis protein
MKRSDGKFEKSAPTPESDAGRARTTRRILDISGYERGESSGAEVHGNNTANPKGQVLPFALRTRQNSEDAGKPYRKLTILIVEDHRSLCDMLSLYFMGYGYHVRTAGDGETALAVLEQEEIQLVLLDLMLPGVDGFTALRQIRERQQSKHPYVIVVSAGASMKDRSRVLELGANEYMPKPFHLTRLLERIQNVEKYLLS